MGALLITFCENLNKALENSVDAALLTMNLPKNRRRWGYSPIAENFRNLELKLIEGNLRSFVKRIFWPL